MIRDKVRTGIGRRGQMRPWMIRGPIAMDVTFKSYRPAELLAWLPIVERRDAHTVRYTAPDILEISRFIEFMMNYCVDIEP